MSTRTQIAAVMAVACLGFAVPLGAEQTGSVALRVDTAGKAAAAGTPVHTGVPFPMGAVMTTDHLRLETAQGAVVPANYWVLASWPDGSIKSVLVSCVPALVSNAYPDLVLQYGPSVTHPASGPVQVAQDAASLTITTDVLKLQFSKQRFSVLEQAWTDLNGDGTFGAGEDWLTGPADLAVVDKKTGNTFRSSLWTAADGYAPKLVESGPQKAVILLDGRLKGVNGALTADGDATLAQAKIWVSIYAGSSVLEVQTTLIDTKSRPTETFSSYVMDLSSVALEAPTALSGAGYAAGGENGAVYQGTVGSQTQLVQDASVSFNANFSYTFSYSGVGTGAKAPGWMDISTGARGATMGLQHFWQTFPHKLLASNTGLLRLEYVTADSSNSFHTVYPGVGKTYEGFLDLHGGSYSSVVRGRAELLLARPLLIATPAWYTGSAALGPLTPRSSTTGPWDTKMENQYTCTALRQGCSIYAQVYGQRDFGDYEQGYGTNSSGATYPEYGDGHYEDAHGFLLEFARTGDRKWFDHALPEARHHYDMDVMHTQNPPRFPGYPAGQIHWHGTSEHEGSTIEFGHIVPGGLDEYYLLSGDQRALEVAREQGDWVEYWARNGGGRIAPEQTGDGIGYTEYERPTAWTLYTETKTYEASGDPKYWEAASILVKNTIDWWKMPQDHIVFDPNKTLDLTKTPQSQALYYQRSDWTQGTGYPLATLRSDNCAQTKAPLDNLAFQNHVPLAWMSGLLQTALIRYYQDLERRGGTYNATVTYRGQPTAISIDTATMREMLIQMANMVADHCYLGAPNYPSQYPWMSSIGWGYFSYSVCPERDPGVGDGSHFMIWPLIFVSSFNQADVSSRWQANWSALQTKWRTMAKSVYTLWYVNDPGPDTGYNGAPNTWNVPFGVSQMDTLGMLSAGSTPPPSGGGSTTPPPPSGGGTTTPPPPSNSSLPAYQVIVNDGNPFVSSTLIDILINAPSAAVQMNISTAGLGQGTWQSVGPVHGFLLSAGSGKKTLYVQFRDSTNTVLASLAKSVVLVEPGFTGDVDLVLNEPRDTFAFSNNANANYGARSVVTAGRYDVGYDYLGLFDFGMPALPAGVTATVKSAALDVYLLDNYRNASQTITPYAPTAAWDEDAVTWNSRPALDTTALGAGVLFIDRSEINKWKTFTLTPSALQGWVQDPTTAHGIALSGAGTPGLTSLDFSSSETFYPAEDRRPRLTLRLTLAAAATAPPVITNLQAVNVGETSATIQWTTDVNADGSVEYGTTTGYGQSAPPQTTLTTTHAIVLTGLTGRTPYHVRVTSTNGAGQATTSADLAFATTGPMLGDVNGDGQVTIADVPAMAAQLIGLAPQTLATADINADGRLTIADLQALVNRL